MLLARSLTGASWCDNWYNRLHQWSFDHFSMPEVGEWRQRLDRQGVPLKNFVALPVKDPFHLPRSLILGVQLLSQH